MLARIYAGIQDQIKFADSKAGFVAAFNALLIGFIIGNFGAVTNAFKATHSWGIALSLAGLVIVVAMPVVVSVSYVLEAVRPRHGANTHKSRFFYAHIATAYGRDANRYSADVLSMTDDEWASDYTHQITEVACIAKDKHDNIRIAIRFALGAFIGIVVVSGIVQITSLLNTPFNPNTDKSAEARSISKVSVRTLAYLQGYPR